MMHYVLCWINCGHGLSHGWQLLLLLRVSEDDPGLNANKYIVLSTCRVCLAKLQPPKHHHSYYPSHNTPTPPWLWGFCDLIFRMQNVTSLFRMYRKGQRTWRWEWRSTAAPTRGWRLCVAVCLSCQATATIRLLWSHKLRNKVVHKLLTRKLSDKAPPYPSSLPGVAWQLSSTSYLSSRQMHLMCYKTNWQHRKRRIEQRRSS